MVTMHDVDAVSVYEALLSSHTWKAIAASKRRRNPQTGGSMPPRMARGMAPAAR